MRTVVLVFLFAVTCAGSLEAHDGMIALFADSSLADNHADLAIGGDYNLEIFYIQGAGPQLGLACEFRLVLSTPDVEFLPPIWSGDIVVTMGDVCSGISLAGSACLGNWYQYQGVVHLGTLPVKNHADPDTFTVSLVGHPGIDPPAVRITECNGDHSPHIVHGRTFTFNGPDAEPIAPWLLDAYAGTPFEVSVVFSEEVTARSAETHSHYSIFETADPTDSVTIVAAELAQDMRIVSLTVGGLLPGTIAHSVMVSGVEDLEGNKMMPESMIGIRITDCTPPAVTALSLLSADRAAIEFSECMDRATVECADYYSLTKYSDPLYENCVIDARLASDGMSAELQLNSQLDARECYYVCIRNIEDWAGNPIPSRISLITVIPLHITHTPVDFAAVGHDIDVLWNVSDYLYGLERTCLYYRRRGEAGWSELCESSPVNPIVMTIPGAEVAGDAVEYYIAATNGIGATAHDGNADSPHVIPLCAPGTCEQPVLTLVGYQSLDYVPPRWLVAVEVLNTGPGPANNVSVTMNEDISWLVIPDPVCYYGDIGEGEMGSGAPDLFQFDLSDYPGGSFNVWFSVTYADSCGNEYQLRLDPEFDAGTAGERDGVIVRTFDLYQNYPNPFNPGTSISYQIPVPGHVTVRIFDASGRLVRTLLDEYCNRGRHTIAWEGTDARGAVLPSGIYFYRLQSGSFSETKKMILLR